MGRLTRDPEIRYTTGTTPMCVAKYTLAVDRRFKRDGEPSADFINCVSFGKSAEFAERYLKQGTKITVSGRIQTGSYINKDGKKVHTTDVVVEEQEFAESKNQNGGAYQSQNTHHAHQTTSTGADGFMNIPDGIDESLPFD